MLSNQLQARPAGRSALLVQARASRGKAPAKAPAKQPVKPTRNSKQAVSKGAKGKPAGGAKGGGELKDGAGEGRCCLACSRSLAACTDKPGTHLHLYQPYPDHPP